MDEGDCRGPLSCVHSAYPLSAIQSKAMVPSFCVKSPAFAYTQVLSLLTPWLLHPRPLQPLCNPTLLLAIEPS